jgi:mono/diheme cytochrome c family protein
MKITSLIGLLIVGGVAFLAAGCAEEQETTGPPPPAPPEYADKHMPAGWWADEKIIAEGKEIFEGVKNIDVNCASCHGKDGKPVKAGARDFRKGERMKQYSDSVWFWRISEGVPNTKMKAWKSKLSEEDRWKAMAYERTFGLPGLAYDVAKKDWVPVAELGKAAPAAGAGKAKAPVAKPVKDAPKKGGK